jgi:predicted RNA binding protein YcfA (HicA-like mRNA interferase family)
MTPAFPSMGSREITRLLKEHEYVEKRQTGSHLIFFHPTKRRAVPVPVSEKDLPVGTLRSILKSAEINLRRSQ